jgi:type VI secretion system secreted protein Hcp
MARADFYLMIEGVDGESQDGKYAKHIEVLSWKFSEENKGTSARGGGGGTGGVDMKDFEFEMWVNKASPKLFLACATGQSIPKAELKCRKAGGGQQEYLKFTFTDVLISSYRTGGADGDGVVPRDTITFNFAKIEMDYKEQKNDGSMGGSVKTGYDLKKNEKV